MKEDPNAASSFSVQDYNCFDHLPFSLLDQLNYSVYVINYDWVYLFINRNARDAYGSRADRLVGQNALATFSDKRFEHIFLEIKDDVERKLFVNTVVDSPLRGSKVFLKGYPLEDCYYFSATIVPAKIEVLNELREELQKRKAKS